LWWAAAIAPIEEGLFITRYASSVTIIHRRGELRAEPFAPEAGQRASQGQFHLEHSGHRGARHRKGRGAAAQERPDGDETIFETDGVFIFIGHTPNTQIFEGKLEMDKLGYLKIDEKMQTSQAGVFAGGEVADPHFRQVVTSAGMGAAAAIQATRFLEAQEE